jgi:DNA-binding protein YbaB
MAREIDEAWVERAIAQSRQLEKLKAELAARVATTEVTVHSPDELVEVLVRADGAIQKVTVVGSLQGRTNVEVSRSIEAAMTAATEAADWARRTMYAETLGQLAR